MAVWDNTTPLDTVVSIVVTETDVLTITMVPSGSITGGIATFEEDDGLGWGATEATDGSGNQQSVVNLSTVSGTTNWTKNVNPCEIRVRLSTVITGSGNITVTLALAGGGGGGGGLNGVNEQAGNYTADATDNGKLIVMSDASAKTLTLPASPPSTTWGIFVENLGAGNLTIDRNGLNIDNAASNLILVQGEGIYISTDGSNYFSSRGDPPSPVLSGTYSTIPAPAKLGRIFIPINLPVGQPDFYFDTGLVWTPYLNFRPIVAGGAGTPPYIGIQSILIW